MSLKDKRAFKKYQKDLRKAMLSTDKNALILFLQDDEGYKKFVSQYGETIIEKGK